MPGEVAIAVKLGEVGADRGAEHVLRGPDPPVEALHAAGGPLAVLAADAVEEERAPLGGAGGGSGLAPQGVLLRLVGRAGEALAQLGAKGGVLGGPVGDLVGQLDDIVGRSRQSGAQAGHLGAERPRDVRESALRAVVVRRRRPGLRALAVLAEADQGGVRRQGLGGRGAHAAPPVSATPAPAPTYRVSTRVPFSVRLTRASKLPPGP
ncbi:hypothetical protein STTU_4942 [Streptomyces sp. Tu6071]|nr:hypothetical protein STTU_4942 [Streptomyces sp. Tu6071]